MQNNKAKKTRSVKVSVAKLENLSWWFKPPVLEANSLQLNHSTNKRNSLRITKS